MNITEDNKEQDLLIAMDRLIYQNDSARIFHCANLIQYKSVKEVMSQFPNRKIWELVTNTFFKEDGYLIYQLRKDGK